MPTRFTAANRSMEPLGDGRCPKTTLAIILMTMRSLLIALCAWGIAPVCAWAGEPASDTSLDGILQGVTVLSEDGRQPPEYIGHVIVRGPEEMQTLLLGRCLPVEEGEAWDLEAARKVEETRRELMALDWVSDAEVIWKPTSDPRVKDLIFEVKASRVGTLYAGLGYRGQLGLAPTAALYQESVFGTLNYFHADWTLGMGTNRDTSSDVYHLVHVEVGRPPICTKWYWNGRFQNSLDPFRYFHVFDTGITEARLTGGRMLPWNFQAEGGYRFADYRTWAPPPAATLFRLPDPLQPGFLHVGGGTLAIVHDTRNDKSYARWGHLLRIEALGAHHWLGSDQNFGKLTLQYHQFLWVASRLVIKPIVYTSWASHGVSFYERAYPLEPEWNQSLLGNSLGPMSYGNETGGRFAAFLGTEFRVLVIDGVLHVAGVAGAANAWDEPYRPLEIHPHLQPFVGIRFDAPIPGGAYLGMSFGWIPHV